MQPRKIWSVSDAKARFSEMIDRALADGPQVVTRSGRRAVVIVSVRDWAKREKRHGTLADFFGASPLRDSGVVIERTKDKPRDTDL